MGPDTTWVDTGCIDAWQRCASTAAIGLGISVTAGDMCNGCAGVQVHRISLLNSTEGLACFGPPRLGYVN